MAYLLTLPTWLLCWSCFWTGHICSLFVNRHSEFWATFWMTPYQYFMGRSYRIQTWAMLHTMYWFTWPWEE